MSTAYIESAGPRHLHASALKVWTSCRANKLLTIIVVPVQEKVRQKAEKDAAEAKYKTATVDGRKEQASTTSASSEAAIGMQVFGSGRHSSTSCASQVPCLLQKQLQLIAKAAACVRQLSACHMLQHHAPAHSISSSAVEQHVGIS